MISISQKELQVIEDQFTSAMFKALEKVQEELQQAAVSPHWVSYSDAVSKMGWPEVLLKNGVKHGHLNPIKLRGKGGTQFDINELAEFKNWLMFQHKSNMLSNKYITATNTLAQKKSDDHVFPHNSRKGRPSNALPRTRKPIS